MNFDVIIWLILHTNNSITMICEKMFNLSQTFVNNTCKGYVHKFLNFFKINYATFFNIFPLFFLLIINTGCNKNPEQVIIRGSLTSFPKHKLFINELCTDTIALHDSITTNRKGNFNITLEVNSPSIYIFTDSNSKLLFSLLLNPGENLAIQSDSSNLTDLVISGSRGSVLLNDLNNNLNRVKSSLDSLSSIYKNHRYDNNFDSIKSELDKVYLSITRSHKQYSIGLISNNLYSPLSLVALLQQYDSAHPVFDPDSDYRYFYIVDTALNAIYPNNKLVKGFHHKFSKYKTYKDLEKKRELMLKPGELFPNIPIELNNGEEFRFTGKWFRLALINFTGKGCSSCINLESLIKIFRAYNHKGLIVLNVDVNLNGEPIPPLAGYDTLGFYNATITPDLNNHILNTLQISSIPANFITDRWGNIKEVNLKSDEIQRKISELLP